MIRRALKLEEGPLELVDQNMEFFWLELFGRCAFSSWVAESFAKAFEARCTYRLRINVREAINSG